MLAAPNNRSGHFLLALITLVALLLRLAYLGQPSLWWDEFISVGASLRALPDMLTVLKYLGPSDIQAEFFPPLYHTILHGLSLLGRQDLLMRLPGVLAGTAMIPALYLLCRRPLGRDAALLAALMAALSVYQMHYAREVRPYALFMLENLLALHALYAAVAEGRTRMLRLYGLCVLAMLHTSYMAAMLVGGQVVFAGLALGWRWLRRKEQRPSVLRTGALLTLALVLAFALYLPWVQGQLNVFAVLRDPGFAPKLDLDFLGSSLREFAAYAYQGDLPTGWVLLGLGLAGAGVAVRRGQGRFVLLLGLFCLMPFAGIMLAKARMELTSRYIFPLSIVLLVFSAYFLTAVVEWTADRLFQGSPPIPAARLLVSLALCLLVNAPNSDSLDGYYRRETSYFKQLMAFVAENTDNRDMILFYTPRNLKVAYQWYAPGLLPEAGDIRGGGYRRAMLLAPAEMDAARRLPGAVRCARLYGVDVLGLGLPRRQWVPMVPGPDGDFVYAENFSDFRMLEDVREARNLAPSLVNKALVAYDSGLPGHAEWRFAAPAGRRVTKVALDVAISFFALADIESDAAVTVALTPEGTPEGAAAKGATITLTLKDFMGPDGKLTPYNHEKKRGLTRHLEFDMSAGTGPETRPGAGPCAGMDAFTLRLDFAKALQASPMQVENFQVRATLSGPPATPAEKPMADLESYAQELPLAPWRSGETLVDSRALHAFSLSPLVRPSGQSTAGQPVIAPPSKATENAISIAGSPGTSSPASGTNGGVLPLGTAEELAAYLAEHPGQKPVKTIAFADGSPAIALYDPALANPWLAVGPGRSVTLSAAPSTERTFAGLGLRGGFKNPVLSLGRASLSLPVVCPAPAELAINPGERGELRFSPLFTEQGLDMDAMIQSANIKRNDGEDCLSCREDGPCTLTYALGSGMPITGFRLEAYPRLFCDPARANTVVTSYSVDGRDFLPLDTYASTGSGRWEGWKVPRRSSVRLTRPTGGVFIRFTLSGPKTQLWSSPDATMAIAVQLDASHLPPLRADTWPSLLALANPTPVEVLLLGTRRHFPDGLRRNH